MVVRMGSNGGIIGEGRGGKWCLGVGSWWRRAFMLSMAWGVKVMVMREGIAWVWCGELEFGMQFGMREVVEGVVRFEVEEEWVEIVPGVVELALGDSMVQG